MRPGVVASGYRVSQRIPWLRHGQSCSAWRSLRWTSGLHRFRGSDELIASLSLSLGQVVGDVVNESKELDCTLLDLEALEAQHVESSDTARMVAKNRALLPAPCDQIQVRSADVDVDGDVDLDGTFLGRASTRRTTLTATSSLSAGSEPANREAPRSVSRGTLGGLRRNRCFVFLSVRRSVFVSAAWSPQGSA
jgi:hypothetical protein